jgi:ParB-like nuclease family protein
METTKIESAELEGIQEMPPETQVAAEQFQGTELTREASSDESPSEPGALEFPIHPLAASYPMLDGEELDALVDDNRVNGLRNPIVLDRTGQLVDGRNRLKACQLAGIEPTFTTTDVDDSIAYIVSANLHCRHLSKGQQAMAFAMAYPGNGEKAAGGKPPYRIRWFRANTSPRRGSCFTTHRISRRR